MSSETVRVNRIFSLLADGIKSAEIIRIEEERRRSIRERLERGNSSEQNVTRVLSGLPIVLTVNRVEPNSVGDQNGIDIVVGLKRDIPEGLVGKVRVQVKSSRQYIAEFKEKIKLENSLKNNEEVNDWLIKNGWIILNGQLPDEIIATSFESQLNKINDFARTEETKADKDDIERRMKEQARRYWEHPAKGTLTPDGRHFDVSSKPEKTAN